jgi:hypothetical protein
MARTPSQFREIRKRQILAANRDSSMLDCGIRLSFLIRVNLHELVEKIAGLEQ